MIQVKENRVGRENNTRYYAETSEWKTCLWKKDILYWGGGVRHNLRYIHIRVQYMSYIFIKEKRLSNDSRMPSRNGCCVGVQTQGKTSRVLLLSIPIFT